METFEIIYLVTLGFFMGVACVYVINITLNESRNSQILKFIKNIVDTYAPDIIKNLNKTDSPQELLNVDGSKYNPYLDAILNYLVDISDNTSKKRSSSKYKK